MGGTRMQDLQVRLSIFPAEDLTSWLFCSPEFATMLDNHCTPLLGVAELNICVRHILYPDMSNTKFTHPGCICSSTSYESGVDDRRHKAGAWRQYVVPNQDQGPQHALSVPY